MWRLAGLLPAAAGRIDELWLGRLESLMDQLLGQTKGVLRALLILLFLPRLRSGLDRFNMAADRYRLKKAGGVLTSQNASFAALEMFVQPLWYFFYAAYAILFLGFVLFLGIPFLK